MNLSDFVKKNYQQVIKLKPEILQDGTSDYLPALTTWLARWAGTDIAVEDKIDGRAVFLFFDKQQGIRLATKHTGTYGEQLYPELFAELRGAIAAKSAIYHCELVPRAQKLHLHDVLYLYPNWVTRLILKNRKLILEKTVREGALVKRVEPVWLEDVAPSVQAKTIFTFKELAVEDGLEGVMVKADAPYGAKWAWTKLKDNETVDAVVIRDHVVGWSWELGLYDGKELVYVGNSNTFVKGFDPALVRPGVVVEVRHQPARDFRHLRNATIIRIRDDKLPEECTIEQLSGYEATNQEAEEAPGRVVRQEQGAPHHLVRPIQRAPPRDVGEAGED